jgi:hypothetical protein
MKLFVDTSVWSLALRRDTVGDVPEVQRLRDALSSLEAVFTTGLVLQELLQGFKGPKAREALVQRFTAMPLLVPDREDHIAASDVRNKCRRKGVQLGTIDALFIQLCIRHDATMLSTDRDFVHAAKHVQFDHWRP